MIGRGTIASLSVLALAACSAPPASPPTEIAAQTNEPSPGIADSSREVVEAHDRLYKGDVIWERPRPPYPDSALVDSVREVQRNMMSLFIQATTEVTVIDRAGAEIPFIEWQRAVSGAPGAKVFVQALVAWDGTLVEAVVVRANEEFAASALHEVLPRLRFTPPYDEELERVLPEGVPTFAWARITLPFPPPRAGEATYHR